MREEQRLKGEFAVRKATRLSLRESLKAAVGQREEQYVKDVEKHIPEEKRERLTKYNEARARFPKE